VKRCGLLSKKWVAAYANRDLVGTMSIFADDINMSFKALQTQGNRTREKLSRSLRTRSNRGDGSQNSKSSSVPEILASCGPHGSLRSRTLTAR